jgi:hypothetical protein
VGRVWPRHGHRGRPLNSVVSQHVRSAGGSRPALAIIGAVFAVVATPKRPSRRPVLAVRLYLGILNFFPVLRASADRDWFSYREQFLATFFIVFFIAFGMAVLGFGCSYRTGCI